jgi:hypothetical protein
MPTKTTKRRPAQRPPRLTRYVAVVGELAAAMKGYQKLLQKIDGRKKIDVKGFELTIRALNKAGDQFDALTKKHQKAILDYVDEQTA